MILLIIGNKPIEELSKVMSQFLDDFRAVLQQVANGQAEEEATKAAVQDLQTRLTANELADADRATAIMELTQALANSTPPAPEPTPEPAPEPTPES